MMDEERKMLYTFSKNVLLCAVLHLSTMNANSRFVSNFIAALMVLNCLCLISVDAPPN